MPSANAKSLRTRRHPLIITIDGPAGVGKSTVAKLLATQLGLQYLDTGATYRALAYTALMRGIDPSDERHLVPLARSLQLTLHWSATKGLAVMLNGRDVSRQIRTEQVTEAAAIVAHHPRVRAALVRLQRRLAGDRYLVVEGRDTGSVVFPHAPYKFFLTANATVRATRRHMELAQLHGRTPSVTVIAKQLRERDQRDRIRKAGPLVKPPGAVAVDTSRMQAAEVVQQMLQHLALPARRPSRQGRTCGPDCQ